MKRNAMLDIEEYVSLRSSAGILAIIAGLFILVVGRASSEVSHNEMVMPIETKNNAGMVIYTHNKTNNRDLCQCRSEIRPPRQSNTGLARTDL